jgi:hypothetical protein
MADVLKVLDRNARMRSDPYRESPPQHSPRWRWNGTLGKRAWWTVHVTVLALVSLPVARFIRSCYAPNVPVQGAWIDLDFRRFFAGTAVAVASIFACVASVLLARVRRRWVVWLPLIYIGAAVIAFAAAVLLFMFGAPFDRLVPAPPR